MRIVTDEFLERSRPVIHHLEEHGPSLGGYAGERPRDEIIHKTRNQLAGDGVGQIGIEDFQKVPKSDSFRFLAKLLVLGERVVIEFAAVVERDRI